MGKDVGCLHFLGSNIQLDRESSLEYPDLIKHGPIKWLAQIKHGLINYNMALLNGVITEYMA